MPLKALPLTHAFSTSAHKAFCSQNEAQTQRHYYLRIVVTYLALYATLTVACLYQVSDVYGLAAAYFIDLRLSVPDDDSCAE